MSFRVSTVVYCSIGFYHGLNRGVYFTSTGFFRIVRGLFAVRGVRLGFTVFKCVDGVVEVRDVLFFYLLFTTNLFRYGCGAEEGDVPWNVEGLYGDVRAREYLVGFFSINFRVVRWVCLGVVRNGIDGQGVAYGVFWVCGFIFRFFGLLLAVFGIFLFLTFVGCVVIAHYECVRGGRSTFCSLSGVCMFIGLRVEPRVGWSSVVVVATGAVGSAGSLCSSCEIPVCVVICRGITILRVLSF